MIIQYNSVSANTCNDMNEVVVYNVTLTLSNYQTSFSTLLALITCLVFFAAQ